MDNKDMRIMELERQLQIAKKKMAAYRNVIENARKFATGMMTQSTKNSSFTNYQVKKWGKQLSDLLQLPLIR